MQVVVTGVIAIVQEIAQEHVVHHVMDVVIAVEQRVLGVQGVLTAHHVIRPALILVMDAQGVVDLVG